MKGEYFKAKNEKGDKVYTECKSRSFYHFVAEIFTL